ncbi:MAG: hypothetical protein ABL958_14370 [Bdellovibrionia bacterium]
MSLRTYVVIGALLSGLGSQAQAVCLNPKEVADDSKSEWVAVKFPAWEQVPAGLKNLLTPYLMANGTGDVAKIYESWIVQKNEQASSFFGIMHALSNIQIDYGGGKVETAALMVGPIMALKGDRIQVKLDVARFEAWRANKGKYAARLGTKVETGNVGFHTGTTIGGSLHCGYDIQGFTKRANPPSVQWNLRYKDAAADIDMDGNSPGFWKIFPNPKHYTYRNSDVRFWFDKFLKRFETPGFAVQKRFQ